MTHASLANLLETFAHDHRDILHDAATNKRFFVQSATEIISTPPSLLQGYSVLMEPEITDLVDNLSDNLLESKAIAFHIVKGGLNSGSSFLDLRNGIAECEAIAKQFIAQIHKLHQERAISWIKGFDRSTVNFEPNYPGLVYIDCVGVRVQCIILTRDNNLAFDPAKWL